MATAVNNYKEIVSDMAETTKRTITDSKLLFPGTDSTAPLAIKYVELKRLIYEIARGLLTFFPRIYQNLEGAGAVAAIGALTAYPAGLQAIITAGGVFNADQARQDQLWRQQNSFELAEIRCFHILRDAMITAGGPLFSNLGLVDQDPTADGTIYRGAEGQTLRGIIVAYDAAIAKPDTDTLNSQAATLTRRQRQGETFTEYFADKAQLFEEARLNGRAYADYQKVAFIKDGLLSIYNEIIDKFDSEFSLDPQRTLVNLKTFMVGRAFRVELTDAARAPHRPAGGRAMETAAIHSENEDTSFSTEDIQQFLAAVMPNRPGGPTSLTADQLLKHVKINDALKELGYHRSDKPVAKPAAPSANPKKAKTGASPAATRTPSTGIDLSTATYCYTHGFYTRPGTGHTGEQCKYFVGPDAKRKATATNPMGGSMKVTV